MLSEGVGKKVYLTRYVGTTYPSSVEGKVASIDFLEAECQSVLSSLLPSSAGEFNGC